MRIDNAVANEAAENPKDSNKLLKSPVEKLVDFREIAAALFFRFTIAAEQIGQRYLVKVIVYQLGKPLPHRERPAEIRARTILDAVADKA